MGMSNLMLPESCVGLLWTINEEKASSNFCFFSPLVRRMLKNVSCQLSAYSGQMSKNNP